MEEEESYAIVVFDPTSPYVDQLRLEERRIQIGNIDLTLQQVHTLIS